MARDEAQGSKTKSQLEAELCERTRALEAQTRALEESETRFRSVIENNADAILVLDLDGVIRFANGPAHDLFGKPAGTLTETSFGYPCVAGATSELDVALRGTAHVVEMRVVETVWEGEPACLASLRDITERKKTEDAARILLKEQVARSAAEEAAGRFRFLAESSTVLSSSLDLHATATALADLCVAQIADWAVIYLIEDDGGVCRSAVAHRDPAKAGIARALRDHPIPRGPNTVLEALRTGPMLRESMTPDELGGLLQDARQHELVTALGVCSFMLVPMIAHDRAIGAIALISSSEKRHFTTGDLELAEDVALRAALAVDNARLYRVAREANQAKSDYLAVISHDLRTPLNAILGHAELLSMGIPEKLGPATIERVDRIRASGAHLLRLIDELLTWVRLDTGHEELHPADVEVAVVARDVVKVVDIMAVERGLDLQLELPDVPVRLHTDSAKLHQILLNLVANAIKYTEQGSVRLLVRHSGSEIVFAISDTGIGISAEHQTRIFDPFWQVDRARVTDGGGTGLGLSVVHRLVRLLGGTVDVQSEEGKGSTFTVTLPMVVRP